MSQSNSEQDRKRKLRLPDSKDYEVGYAKPPKASRFKSGQSGNPNGRPRGSRNKQPALNEERLKSIILDEAYRTITVNDGARPITVPMAQAVVRSLAVNAAKGNAKAQRLFTDLLTSTERENKHLHDEWLETAINYKVEWEGELRRREKAGTTGPDPLPHPDHIEIDMRTGQVKINGPMTREEKATWDMFKERKKQCDSDIAELEKLLEDQPEYPHRDAVLRDIEFEKKIREIICRNIPD